MPVDEVESEAHGSPSRADTSEVRAAPASGAARLRSYAGVFAFACAIRLAVWAVGVALPHEPALGSVSARLTELPLHWDGSWYVGLASGGYRYRPEERRFVRVAFFPAYPLALRATASAMPIPHTSAAWGWTGSLLSAGFFATAAVLLWRLVAAERGRSAAWTSVALLASYPFALFFGQPYTESLFLLSAVGAVAFASQGQIWHSAAFGVLAGLSRPNGLLVGVFLLLCWLGYDALRPSLRPVARRRRWLGLVPVVSPAVGTCAYSAYVWWLTGRPLTWLAAQDTWGRTSRSLWSVGADVWVRIGEQGVGGFLLRSPFEAINIAAILATLAMLPIVFRQLGLAAGVFAALNVILPLIQGGTASAGRYSAVVFPIFVALALTLPRAAAWAIVGLFFALQVLVARLFFGDHPVF
jgi:hypothetical protein